MKLNYYTYEIYNESKGTYHFENLSKLIENYCQSKAGMKQRKIKNPTNGRELYLAASDVSNVFFLLCPAIVRDFKSVSKSTGKISNIKELLPDESLEKVTYIYIDERSNFIAMTNPLGGARHADLQLYLNSILDERIKQVTEQEFSIRLIALESTVTKSSLKKMHHISRADININKKSALEKFFSGKDETKAFDDLEITISFKRKDGKKRSIGSNLAPVLDAIIDDVNSEDFGDVHLKARLNSLSEHVKDVYLDQTKNVYEVIYTSSSKKIEIQIQECSHANENVQNSLSERLDEIESIYSTDINLNKALLLE
ncbi:hypothetical protein [Pseudoalteromonas luteoviolacea]|uniref:hypothetical protein n=1 Tax=Pseudoalteromonas luteoviolacea TaxID=43657 RepID=UPI0011541562|nr:hypothetical protein [Pseudoalteromonas luteoviolacea]TQF71137.1 hypothetical protein FLM44_08625 [Pseudoalteromonas luteoviolacea]